MNFSRDFLRQDPRPAGRPAAVIRNVFLDLLAVMRAEFNDDFSGETDDDETGGMVTCRFHLCGAECLAAVSPLGDESVVLGFHALLGRIHCRYPAALRWLAANRSNNTVALAYCDATAAAGELHVSANRPTLCGDVAGIHLALIDFCYETRKAITGVKLWFPRFVEAEELAYYDTIAEQNGAVACAMANPKATWRHLADSRQLRAKLPSLFAYLTFWTRPWPEILQLTESRALRQAAQHDPMLMRWLPTAQLCALMHLRQYHRAIHDALPAVPDDAIAPAARAAMHAQCLCHLGRFRDALAHLDGPAWDDEPRVELVRSLAASRLGRSRDAQASFAAYERLIGPDPLARRMVGHLRPSAVTCN